MNKNVQDFVIADTFGIVKSGLRRDAPVVKFPLFRRHAVLCGTLMFNLNLRMQELGLYLQNARVDAQCLSYLYNTLQVEMNENLMSPKWPDMELFIATQGEEMMFIGSRPKTVGEANKKLAISQGISAGTFAPNA